MERDTLFLISLLAAIVLGLLVAVLWPEDEEGVVTCTSDEQCGGDVALERFCREGKLYANGQQNTCVNPGTVDSECITTYDPWLVGDSC